VINSASHHEDAWENALFTSALEGDAWSVSFSSRFTPGGNKPELYGKKNNFPL
jgi:hypothetical protein